MIKQDLAKNPVDAFENLQVARATFTNRIQGLENLIKNSEKLRVANLELKDKLLKRDAEFKTLQETSGGSNEEIANLKLNIELKKIKKNK